MVDCRDGAPHGQLRVWSEYGKVVLLSGEYRHGEMNGLWKEGTPPHDWRGSYRDGQLVEGVPIDVQLVLDGSDGQTGRRLCENDNQEDVYLGENDRVPDAE